MDGPMESREAADRTAPGAPCVFPWEVAALAEDSEPLGDAARRIGKTYFWLRRRAVRMGLICKQRVGRPRKGQEVRLTHSQWNAVAAPMARILVPVGSLQARTGVDWRVILLRCHELGLVVYVDHPDQRVKYAIGATSAETVVASLKADAKRTPLRVVAAEMGIHHARLQRILDWNHLRAVRGKRRRLLVDLEVVRAAVLADLATETLCRASSRTGVPRERLRQWLAEGAVLAPCATRRKSWLDPAVVDAVIARQRKTPLETLRQAVARTGVKTTSLRRALIAAGVVMIGQGRCLPWLEPAVVDAALNNRKSKDVH